MRVPRSRSFAAATAAAALVLTACGAGEGEDTGDSGAVTVDGGQPENPLVPGNTNEVFGGDVLDTIFSKLVRYDPETAEPENDVAESIETEDDQTYTITIEEGWTFHDGTDVLAHNFVDAWNDAAYGPNGFVNNYWFSDIEGYEDLNPEPDDPDDEDAEPPEPDAEEMSGLEVVDDYTFTVTLAEPFALFPFKLGYSVYAPLPDSYFDDPEGFGQEPIGNGPFEFESWTNNEEITVTRYDDYPGEEPAQIETLTWQMYDDREAAYNDLLAGNLDIMTRLTPAALADDLYQDDLGDRYVEQEAGLMFTATITVNEDGYDNAKFRQALSVALDRETIVEQIFNDSQLPADGWAPSVVVGAAEGACGEYCQFDPDFANELLDEAEDEGWEAPEEVTFYFNDDADHREWVEAAVTGWNQVFEGRLEAAAQPVPTFDEFRSEINERNYEGLLRTGWQMDYPHIENWLTPLFVTGASSNDGDFSNEEFDDLVNAANLEDDEDAAIEMYQEAERILAEEMPSIPVYTARTVTGYSENMAHVEVTPFGVPAFQRLETN